MIGDQLTLAKKLSFGVGHVLNDLSASMWFSYLLIYLHRIVLFENALAGYMMLLGQVADAFSTGFVGFESDRTKSGFCNYGRRKSWHLVGKHYLSIISLILILAWSFILILTFSCYFQELLVFSLAFRSCSICVLRVKTRLNGLDSCTTRLS